MVIEYHTRNERTAQTINQIIDVRRDHGWTRRAFQLRSPACAELDQVAVLN